MTQIWSWNVNGMRAVVRNGFMDWFNATKPEILCLQETRVHPEQIDNAIAYPKGYHAVWTPAQKKGYSGVATFSKHEPLAVSTLGKGEFDEEGRVQIIEFDSFVLINAYWPNSQPERKRLDYKLAFVKAMQRCGNQLRRSGKNVILCGDYNIAHKEIDIARPKQNVDNPGFLPEEREAMTKFLKAGYKDTFRMFNQDPHNYTWWSYRANARAKNVGWRLDYHCVNKEFAGQVTSAEIHGDVIGSDHCPVTVTVDV